MKTILPLALLALACTACHSSEEEIDEAPRPTNVPFEGAPDARLAGDWSTSDGKLLYTFKADGGYSTDLVMAIKGKGDSKTHSEGEWRRKDDRLLFKDAAGNVVPYACDLKGDTLTLTSVGSLKGKTVLKKK